MSRLDNYKAPNQPTVDPTIHNLQAYIQELVNYINQNNDKYTHNMETIKRFYEDKLNNIQADLNQTYQENLLLKNEINSVKDVLLKKNKDIQQTENHIMKLKTQIDYQQQKNKRMQNHIDQLMKKMQQQIEYAKQQKEQVRNQKQKALEQLSQARLTIKQRDSTITIQKDTISSLHKQIDDRISLPDKIKHCEIENAKMHEQIKNLKSKLIVIQKQRDFNITQLNKLKKQNQNLKIQTNASKSDIQYKIEIQNKKIRQKYEEMLEKIKIEKERLIFEINQLQGSLKKQSALISELEIKVSDQANTIKTKDKELSHFQKDKNQYLAEFRRLKQEYQRVINNLEEAIPLYQKKNWDLQEENQQLHAQLDGLQQLLREIKAMNALQPLRKDYRQWAQMELAADNQFKNEATKKSRMRFEAEKTKQKKIQNQTQLDDLKWKKVMNDLENIQI